MYIILTFCCLLLLSVMRTMYSVVFFLLFFRFSLITHTAFWLWYFIFWIFHFLCLSLQGAIFLLFSTVCVFECIMFCFEFLFSSCWRICVLFFFLFKCLIMFKIDGFLSISLYRCHCSLNQCIYFKTNYNRQFVVLFCFVGRMRFAYTRVIRSDFLSGCANE